MSYFISKNEDLKVQCLLFFLQIQLFKTLYETSVFSNFCVSKIELDDGFINEKLNKIIKPIYSYFCTVDKKVQS